MILAVDVDYKNHDACIAGVAFSTWTDEKASAVYCTFAYGMESYKSGTFYKRELPCILQLLQKYQLKPRCIVIDGFVFLDECGRPGLGKHLFDALDGKIHVIGVAKRPFKGISERFELYRGSSHTPLYITSEGLGLEEAKERISVMHGKFRVPTLLKEADKICRSWQCQ